MFSYKSFTKNTNLLTKALIITLFVIFSFVAMLSINFGGKAKINTSAEVNPDALTGFTPIALELQTPANPYDRGTNPYIIDSVDGLRTVAYWTNTVFVNQEGTEDDELYASNIQNQTLYSRAAYFLQNSLDISAYNWEPIGTESNAFSGIFLGNGHSIVGLNINRTYETYENTGNYSYSGLFGKIAYYYDSDNSIEYRVIIKNLGLKNTKIYTNATYSGAIVGGAFAPPVEEGGIVPVFPSGNSTNSAVGAVVIQECYNTGHITGSDYVGGLVGILSQGAVIYNSYNMGLSQGEINSDDVSDVYSSNSNGSVGGIAGDAIYANAVIYKCYNIATISRLGEFNNTSINLGGILGNQTHTTGSYSNSFYLSGILPEGYPTSNNTVGSSVQKSTLQNYSSFANKSWSIFQEGATTFNNTYSTIWVISAGINNGYPFLANTLQLYQIKLVDNLLDEQNAGDGYFQGYLDMLNPVLPNNNHPAIIIDANNFYFTAKSDVWLDVAIANNLVHNFEGWYSTPMSNSAFVPGSTLLNKKVSTDTIFRPIATNDIIFNANFAYELYSINYATNDTGFGAVRAVSNSTNDFTSISEESYGANNASITARYNDYVNFVITPNQGYQIVDSNTWSLNAVVQTASNNSTSMAILMSDFIVNNNDTINVIGNIESKEYAFAVQIATGQTTLGAVSYLVNNAPNTTGIVRFGDQIQLTPNATAPHYKFSRYTVNADGMTEVEVLSSEQNLSVTVNDYNNYVITVYFAKEQFTVSISTNNSAGATVGFGATVPGTNSSARVLDYDQNTNISLVVNNGYEYSEWQIKVANVVQDLTTFNPSTVGDITTYTSENLVFTINNTNYQLTFITRYVDVIAIAQINTKEYTITLEIFDTITSTATGGAVTGLNMGNNQLRFNNRYQMVATPSIGYYFVKWTDKNNNELSTNTTYIYTVSGQDRLIANFAVYTYNVTVIVEKDTNNYTLNAQNCFSGQGVYRYGENVTINAITPLWFNFNHWAMPEGVAKPNNLTFNNTAKTASIQGITNNITIRGYFSLSTSQVTFTPNNDKVYATFNGSKVENVTTNTVVYGNNIDLNSTNAPIEIANQLNNKYVFVGWKLNGFMISTQPIISVKVDQPIMNFEPVYRAVELNVKVYAVKWVIGTPSRYVSTNEVGFVTGLETVFTHYNNTIHLETTANQGYQFDGWYFTTALTNRGGTAISRSTSVDFTVLQSGFVVASYIPTATLSLSVADIESGTVAGSGTYKLSNNPNDKVSIKATANAGYSFVEWRENGIKVNYNQTDEINLTKSNVNLQAVFKPVFKLNVLSSDDDLGFVSGSGDCEYNEAVTISALPQNNCTFIGWVMNDSIISTNKTLTVTASGDMEIKALFKKNFDWNILVVLFGCLFFAVIIIAGTVYYIKIKETEPVRVRVLLAGKDDKDKVIKSQKRDQFRDKIEPVPTRKMTKPDVSPIPVRKIVVPPKIYEKNKLKKDLSSTSKRTEKTASQIKNEISNKEKKTTTKKSNKK